MKTRVVHQTRLVLIAFLIAFGLPGVSYADGSSRAGTPGLAYSPDGHTLASGHYDSICLWDATTGELLNTLTEHVLKVKSVAYSPDGHTLASGDNYSLRLWDATTGELLNTLTGPGIVESVAYSPDGHTLASGGRTIAHFWDIASYTGGEPTAVAETSWGRIKRHLQGPLR